MSHGWQHSCGALGAKPFLTDCNTLYSGRRANAVDHLESAMENGFNPISAKCDVIIADGLKGTECREIEIDGEYCKAPKIGSALADADIIISMTHFKGHEQTGFGGALKNLGMGGASVRREVGNYTELRNLKSTASTASVVTSALKTAATTPSIWMKAGKRLSTMTVASDADSASPFVSTTELFWHRGTRPNG